MNGKKKLGSSDDITRAYLKSALENMLAAGRSVHELVEFSLERFGDGLIPDLKGFLGQVQSGEIKIKGLPEGAREALFGMRMTPQEREDLVRLTAYVRAERRGFVGGSPEEDWQASEREVDDMLAAKIGLVSQGRRALSDVSVAIEREVGDIKSAVTSWLEQRADSAGVSRPAAEGPTPGPAERTAKNKAAKKPSVEKNTGAKAPAKKTETAAGKKSGKSAESAGGKKRGKK
jgi:hypothetical protein